ncbi:unnamed protein product [Caenorhabditis brenneri]
MPSGNMMKLNIGGTVFQTTKSTLTKFDGFFKAMLETDIPLERDEHGAIFIDRSPKHFELILNYMRDGSVSIPDSKAATQEIQTEAQYYLLDGLVKLCKSKIPEEIPVKLPIIESDAQLLNLIASSEITGKRVLVIYKNIAGKINDSEPNFDIKNFMKKHKNNYDIWFRALNTTDGEDSHYRIFGKPASAGATGPLATLEKALERTVQRRLRGVNQLEIMSSGNIVELNIGGTVFQTTKSTLTKFDGFFKTMLETDIPLEKDKHGAIFIDRSPKHFELILNYMRDGSTEAQYYLLDGLVKLCVLQKPVTDRNSNHFLKSNEELVNAVLNSTKKPNSFEIMTSGNIVELNIGGSVFQTTKSTLTKFDGFFKTMLETDIPLEKDKHGAIFIDRSPKHFELILNYMRDGSVNIPDSKAATQEIQTEAQYYLLDGLVKLCVLQKPVTDSNCNHFLSTIGEVINAHLNSTKKAVIMIPYEAGSLYDAAEAVDRTKKIMKYVADFDVYFVPADTVYLPNCRISNASTGKIGVVRFSDLDKYMKNNYGIE